ncbi:MAG: tetratricopeptide repeat protein [Bacteroidales bacterium]
MIKKETDIIQDQNNNPEFIFIDQNFSSNDPFTFSKDRPTLLSEIKNTTALLNEIKATKNSNPNSFQNNYITGLIQLAYLHFENNDFDIAINYFKEALSNIKHLQKSKKSRELQTSEARIIFSIGNLYSILGKYRRARKLFIKSINKNKNSNLENLDLIALYEGFADFYLQKENLGQAKRYYNKALCILEENVSIDKQSKIRSSLTLNYKISRLEKSKGNLKAAFNHCQKTIMFLEELKVNYALALEIKLNVNFLWIEIQLQSGDFESAMHNILETESFFVSLSKEDKINHYKTFAKICQEMGDYFMVSQISDNALNFYRKAIQFYQETPEYDYECMDEHASILNNMAAIFINLNKLEKVEKLLFKSLEIRKELFTRDPEEQVLDYAGTLVNLAVFYVEINIEDETPRKLLQESLNLLTKYDPEIYDTDERKYSEIMTRTMLTIEILNSN